MLTRLQLGAHHLLQTRLQALGVLSKEKSKFCGAQGQVKDSTQTESTKHQSQEESKAIPEQVPDLQTHLSNYS